ncbi:unnamed protein product [Mycena citricolor]|uniref:Protein kinase domain-containing protein n=1 Tax=Mycena citricolor TaxID=2018698 RepID=A0AAD2HM57_9AGAR|nr:unnamed protein product [Mycena citricolor]
MPGLSSVASWDELPPSPASTSGSSATSFDDDEVNVRVQPYWPDYRNTLKLHGYRLETVQDAKDFYLVNARCPVPESFLLKHGDDEPDALCHDSGLPENLFRGARARDRSVKVVVKAVHLHSRELGIIQTLARSPLRDDPMNHCIPVLDVIELPEDDLAFIVMEQWSSQLVVDSDPCCLRLFLAALRQAIEHVAFMHRHRMAHLDISLRNLLTDYRGHYAYIDYELSRKFEALESPRICNFRTTEVPPECETSNGDCPDAFKADVWAMGILILRASKLTGYCLPELVHLVRPMLNADPADRPSIEQVLVAFEKLVCTMQDLDRLHSL